MLETSLRANGQRRLAEIGVADILIGIPSYKNAPTIGCVMDTAAKGAQTHFPLLRSVIAVVDGGSSDDTVPIASTLRPAARDPPDRHDVSRDSRQGERGARDF